MKRILSLIFSLLFWVPVLGTAFAAIALILGINAYKEDEDKLLPMISIFLSILGLLIPILIIVMLFVSHGYYLLESGFMSPLFDLGIIDIWMPFIFLALLLGMILFIILEIIKLNFVRNSIISIIAGSTVSIIVSIPHIFGMSSPDADVVNIINSALPNVIEVVMIIVIVLLLIYLFVIRKRK